MFPRSLLAAVLLVSPALAAPTLTTVQDMLYKADGTRFNGTLTIAWNSFQAADRSAIVTQSTTVKVVDGNLRVQLVPNATSSPQTYYVVTYNSDGRVQFQEIWSVPLSPQPLRVRDVRMAAPNLTAADTGGGSSGPIQESDVVGLIGDLGARPAKGPGFAAGRVAVISALGNLESASGDPGDCVRVDGSSGPCGSQAASFVDGDTLAGLVDGSNTSFSLTAMPDPPTSLAVYRNGLLQKIVQDYTVAGRTVQFVAANAPAPGDTLLASYRLTGVDASAPQPFPGSQVLCSGTGTFTNSTALASIGSCSIPAGLLAAGDRVEIRFDVEHQGTASGFSVEVHWGATTVLHRDAAATETLVTARADSAVTAAGAQLSHQSWGAALAFSAGVAASTDSYTDGLTIDFQGKLAQAGDTVTLRAFTVVRLP